MDKQKREGYHTSAKSLRSQADKLRQEADGIFQQHVELLRKVYPEPNPSHKIQVLINYNSGSSENLFSTSFPGISEYKQARQQLGWPYGLCTEQVEVCEQCDEFYMANEGVKYYDEGEGISLGFCTKMCLENYKIEQVEEAEHLEFMMENFPDQYERVDGEVKPKAPSPKLQKAFQEAQERVIGYQAKGGAP